MDCFNAHLLETAEQVFSQRNWLLQFLGEQIALGAICRGHCDCFVGDDWLVIECTSFASFSRGSDELL